MCNPGGNCVKCVSFGVCVERMKRIDLARAIGTLNSQLEVYAVKGADCPDYTIERDMDKVNSIKRNMV